MTEFTVQEKNLLFCYESGSRKATLSKLERMMTLLQKDENELQILTENVISKLHLLTDQEYDQLDIDICL